MAEDLSSEFNYTATVVQYTILEGTNISSQHPTAVIKITANPGYTVTAGDFSWNGPLAGVTSVAFTQDGEFVLCTVTYDTTSVMPAYNVNIGLCIIGDAVLAGVNIAGTLTTLVDPNTVTTTPSETNTPYSASGAEGATSGTLFTRTYTAASGNYWPDNNSPSIQLTNGNLGQYNITQTPTYTANDELIAITYTVTYIFTDQDVAGDSFDIVIPKQVLILVPATGITAFLGDNRTVSADGTNYIMRVQGAPGATYSISMSDGTTSAAVVTNVVMGDAGSAQHNFIIPNNTGASNITWTATISGDIEPGVPTTIIFDQAHPVAPAPPIDVCTTFSSTSATLSSNIISPLAVAERQLFMRADGLAFYVQRFGDQSVSQASLAVANDPTSTISYVNVSPTLTSIPLYKSEGLRFSSDGSKMFIGDTSSANFKIHRFILSTPWDISTASSTSDQQVSFTNGGGGTYDNVTFVLSADGTKIFGFMRDAASVNTYESIKIVLTTPYDLSTAQAPVNTVLDSLFALPGMSSPLGASGSAYFPASALGGDDYILFGRASSITAFANDVTIPDFASNSGTASCGSSAISPAWNSSNESYLFAILRTGQSPYTYTLSKYTLGP